MFQVPLAVIDGQEVLQLAKEAAAAEAEAGEIGARSNSDDSSSGSHRLGQDSSAAGNASQAAAVGLPELLSCIANLDDLEKYFDAGSAAMAALMEDTGALAAAAAAAVVATNDSDDVAAAAADDGAAEVLPKAATNANNPTNTASSSELQQGLTAELAGSSGDSGTEQLPGVQQGAYLPSVHGKAWGTIFGQQ